MAPQAQQENPISELTAFAVDVKASWLYVWPVAGETVPTLFGSDFFRNKSQLSIGDQIRIIADSEIVFVLVIRIDAGIGPIVTELQRVPRQ